MNLYDEINKYIDNGQIEEEPNIELYHDIDGIYGAYNEYEILFHKLLHTEKETIQYKQHLNQIAYLTTLIRKLNELED